MARIAPRSPCAHVLQESLVEGGVDLAHLRRADPVGEPAGPEHDHCFGCGPPRNDVAQQFPPQLGAAPQGGRGSVLAFWNTGTTGMSISGRIRVNGAMNAWSIFGLAENARSNPAATPSESSWAAKRQQVGPRRWPLLHRPNRWLSLRFRRISAESCRS